MDSKTRRVDILSNHDLFRFLQGNPTSISRAAKIYMNSLEKEEVKTLQGLYKMFKQSNFSESDNQA